jgi:hypothetical protein
MQLGKAAKQHKKARQARKLGKQMRGQQNMNEN